MFNDREYNHWLVQLRFNREAREMIDNIRSSQPIRLVRSNGSNVTGQYPSRKMGRTLQFESHRCELAFIQQMEHDDDVLEMWDQPASFNISYLTKSGRKATVPHVPDFFVCRKEYAEFVECKTEEDLIELSREKVNRYYRDENGVWRSPPAEEFLKPFGIRYTIKSTASLNRTYIRNLDFLEEYMRDDGLSVSDGARTLITTLIRSYHGITLSDLLAGVLNTKDSPADADDVYSLIVLGGIYVDLYAEPLVERERVRVYEDAGSAPVIDREGNAHLALKAQYVDFGVGTRLLWDNTVWQVSNVGEANLWLAGEHEDTALTHQRFEKYLSEGIIRLLDTVSEKSPYAQALETFNNAPPHFQTEANRRHTLIKPYLSGEKTLGRGAKNERTLRRYMSNYKNAEAFYEYGLVGLLPNWYADGKSVKRLTPAVYEIMDRRIEGDYEKDTQQGMFAVYGKVLNDCDELGIPENQQPSYPTFRSRVLDRPKANQTRKRKGKRAAYEEEEFIYWLEPDTPVHGDRPFHIAHADHTKLDIELVCPITGENLGRPWASFLVDAYSRRLLAIVVTFDPPSYRSTMMLMRECVRRHKRLPQILVVDRGREFDNRYFRHLMAAFEITVKVRPAARPRHGSVGERLFHTANKQFVHMLLGNTQIMKLVRQVTKSHNPKNLAVWTLGAFVEWFTAWGYQYYDQRTHWTLKQSPLEMYARSVELTGKRRRWMLKYDETFRILTMPAPRKLTAKNTPRKGVKINNIYYKCEELKSRRLHNKQLYVRYDPFDVSIAYVYIRDRWVRCTSDHFTTFHYCTERQLRIISREIRRKDAKIHKGRSLTAKELADFITAAEHAQAGQARNVLLLRQRRRDREVAPHFRVIDGGLAPAPGEHLLSPSNQVALLPPAADAVETAAEGESTPFFSAVDVGDLGYCEELS